MVEEEEAKPPRVYVPDMSADELEKLLQQVRPIVSGHYIAPVHPTKIAFNWDPKFEEKATGLVPLCTITTYHEYGYYGFFKPCVAEVIKQIPAEHRDRCVAFEIVRDPDIMRPPYESFEAGYQEAITRFYAKEEKDG